MVEPEYIISASDICKVLESTLRGDLSGDIEPLDNLYVVEQRLIERDLPPKPVYRRLVLVDLLNSEISLEYKQRRIWANRQLPRDDLPAQIIHQLIAEDSNSSGNPAILGWLWLYLKYVRRIPELRANIFAQHAHIDRRTLQRYQNLALRQLAMRLMQLEVDARTTRRQARLKAQLPRLGRVTCIGREREIRWITGLLRDRHGPVVIIGPQGVGKSVLAESITGHMIENGLLDSVMWLENVEVTTTIEDQLRERFLGDHSTTTVQEFLFLRRVLVVLDNVSSSITSSFADEMKRLQGAMILVTSRSLLNLHHFQAVRLDGLSFDATVRFLEYLDFRKHILKESFMNVAAEVHQLTNGNPLLVEDQYRHYVIFGVLLPAKDHHVNWCHAVYEQLSSDARLVWAVLSVGPLRYSDLVSHVFPGISAVAFEELSGHLVIEDAHDVTEPPNLLAPATRQFLQDVYSQDASLQITLRSWIMRIADNETPSDTLIGFLEQVLQAYWIGMDDSWRTQCIQRIWW